MKSNLIIDKEEFTVNLKNFISQGQAILDRYENFDTSEGGKIFEKIEKDYNQWNSFNSEYLKQSFEIPNSEYLKSYENSGAFDTGSISMVMRGANPDNINFRMKFFGGKIEAKIHALEDLINRAQLIPSIAKKETVERAESKNINKVFISHSPADKETVDEVIELLEAIGLGNGQIFCSSIEGYGIELGENFLERIKTELDSNVLVLFILTQNFYNNPVCLCEMGASWIKTNLHIPVIVPPFTSNQMEGVIPLTQGFQINEKLKLNSFKTKIESLFNIPNILELSTWERKRDRVLERINEIIKS